MNIEYEILKEHSKQQVIRIASWIGNDKRRFAVLMDLLLHGEKKVVQRSAWIVGYCIEKNPALMIPWLGVLIKKVQEKNIHNAVQRNVVRSLQFIDIPKKERGRVANLCFNFLTSVESPIAVKALSMTVLANIAQHEPDLKKEIVLVISEMLPYGSAGIQSRGKKILHQFSR